MKYDAEGYNPKGRRQILGYSRLAQGGADQARARAAERLALARDPSLASAQRRSRNVAEAKAEGSFDETRETYNEEGQAAGVEMDKVGTIRRKAPQTVMAKPYQYLPPKPARSTPMSMARPAGQKVAETVAMTEPAGLLDMARKARRKGTLVIR
jgi:hypothetical protein